MEKQNPFLNFWQRAWWSKLITIAAGLFIFFIILGILSPEGQKGFEEGKEAAKDTVQSSEPKASPSPSPATEASPPPTPHTFDSKLGNNYIAAEFAEEFLGIVNKATPGYVKSVRVDLTPEDLGGKSEEDYKKSLISVYLTVKVDNYLWNTTSEGSKKDLTAAFLNSITNSFGGIRHVIVTNGVRTVAEGEWPLFGGDPKITLK